MIVMTKGGGGGASAGSGPAAGGGAPSAGGSPGGGGGPDEWSQIRSVISSFDGNLHDLRKTGFSGITALLTATAISALFALPNYEIFTLIILNYAIIVLMQYLDQDYQQFQGAAMTRARALEPQLNVELSETIASRYDKSNLKLVGPLLYSSLIVIAALLGCSIIGSQMLIPVSPNNSTVNITAGNIAVASSAGVSPGLSFLNLPLFAALIVLGAVAIILIMLIPNLLIVNLRRKDTGLSDDWIIDKVSCQKGDTIKITVTNIGETNGLRFSNGDIVCTIRDGKDRIVDTITAKFDVTIPAYNNYSWLWDTSPEHIRARATYRLTPFGWKEPLERSVTVNPKDPTAPDASDPFPEIVKPGESWSFDKSSCNQGDVIVITVTNLGLEDGISFDATDPTVFILDDSGGTFATLLAKKGVFIPVGDSYSWIWDTTGVPGNALYRVRPAFWRHPMKQHIVVLIPQPPPGSTSPNQTPTSQVPPITGNPVTTKTTTTTTTTTETK